MIAQPWMDVARTLLGVSEIPGPKTAPAISKMLRKLNAWWGDDETPWCGTTVGYCLSEAGIAYPKAWYRAKAYATWGVPVGLVDTPFGTQALSPAAIPYGAVVVLNRKGGGHVGFYCGSSGSGFALLGGNQNNEVNVASYLWSRLTEPGAAVRWPAEVALPTPPYRYPEIRSLVASRSEA